jgi:membrane dipeptidase
MSTPPSDRTPLLDNGSITITVNNVNEASGQESQKQEEAPHKHSGIVTVIVTFVFITAVVVSFAVWNERLSSNPRKAALSILDRAPVIVSA